MLTSLPCILHAQLFHPQVRLGGRGLTNAPRDRGAGKAHSMLRTLSTRMIFPRWVVEIYLMAAWAAKELFRSMNGSTSGRPFSGNSNLSKVDRNFPAQRKMLFSATAARIFDIR